MKVPYFDLKEQYTGLRDEVLTALDKVCENSAFILGNEVTAFENAFAAYCDAKHCVAMNSGTSALHLALLGAGVKAGHEVITVPNTFIATVEAILYTGAKPILVDIDPKTFNIDPQAVERAITPKTKAILPVHLYGRPADLDAIQDIAERHKLAVIEDACQAHGARYRGRRVGALGHAGAFSFYPGKNLGAYGEGGALVTNDDTIADLARSLRSHGESKRYEHRYVGYNYRMDGFQGAVLRIKLKYLDTWTEQRQELAALYRDLLTDAPISLPQDDPRNECVYHLFPIFLTNRSTVRAALVQHGIDTGMHYPIPIHLNEGYKMLGYGAGDFPNAEKASAQVISLPIYPEMKKASVEYIAESLLKIIGPN